MHILNKTYFRSFRQIQMADKTSVFTVRPSMQTGPFASVIDINVGIILDIMGQVLGILGLMGLYTLIVSG